MAVLQGPLANWMVRRFGFKTPLYLGTVCVGLGQCMAGVTTSFAGFIVCQGLVFGFGMGLILVPSQPLIAHWFDHRLSLAQGIGQAGSGVGALIFSNTTPLLLHSLGVKWTYVINGCICFAMLFPAIFLLKGRHKAIQAKSAPLQFSFFWHPGYRWLLVWAFFTSMFGVSSVGLLIVANKRSDGILYHNLHPRIVLHQRAGLVAETRRRDPVNPRRRPDRRPTNVGLPPGPRRPG